MSENFFVYILTTKRNTVLYTGVTNDLKKRVYEHKEKMADGFTKKYGASKLVYYEIFGDPENAILREKQIKGGSRQKKIELINLGNPGVAGPIRYNLTTHHWKIMRLKTNSSKH